MKRGEVWWLELPDEGRRPFLVLTRSAAIAVLDRVVAVPATRRRRDIPTEVALERSDGMPAACVLSLDNVRTLPKGLLTRRICELGVDRMGEVCAALRIATGC